MDKSNSLATAWIDGKPHKPGLYVIEWLNGGGLSVILATVERTWRNVSFGKPFGPDIPWKNYAIRRHLLIPETPFEKYHPTHYDDFGGSSEDRV